MFCLRRPPLRTADQPFLERTQRVRPGWFNLHLRQDVFTHVFLDEPAQALLVILQ
jgi:hypothetical protein